MVAPKRTQRQLERCELSRRLLYASDLVGGRAYVKGELVKARGPSGDDEGFAPRFASAIKGWGSRCDLREIEDDAEKDNALIVAVPAAALGRLRRMRGVEILKPDVGELDADKLREVLKRFGSHAMQKLLHRPGLRLGQFDRWSRPFADRAAGRLSWAHTSTWTGTATNPYPCSGSYDPLSNGPFTRIATAIGSDCLREADGVIKIDSGTVDHGFYRWDTDNQPPNDCTIRADVAGTGPTYYTNHNLIVRCNGSDEFYQAQYMGAADDNDGLWMRHLSGWTQIASSASSGVSSGLRLEVVGTTLKAYLDGSSTEDCSASDSTQATGYAGLKLRRFSTDYDPTIDNLEILVEATGVPKHMQYYRRMRQ